MRNTVRGTTILAAAFGLALLLAACGTKDEPSSSSKSGEHFLRCAEPYDDGGTERFELRPLVLTRDGYQLEIGGITRGQVVLGMLSGIMEPLPETLSNLRHFLARFQEAGVQAIVVPGGLGLDPDHVATILRELSTAPVPILAVPGAQEHFDVFRKTLEEMRKTAPQLIDMTRVRKVTIGHLDLVSLPGYYKPYYLAAQDRGCSYAQADLDATAGLFDPKRTSVLIAPSPPHCVGEHAVDRGRGEVNIGDPQLTAMLDGAGVRFGLFGHVYESGGHATGKDGSTPLLSGVWHDSLYLQAGAAEAIPVTMVGGGRAAGMAHILEYSGKRSRFRTLFGPGSQS